MDKLKTKKRQKIGDREIKKERQKYMGRQKDSQSIVVPM